MDDNFTTYVLTTDEVTITSDEFGSRVYERIMISPLLLASLYLSSCSLIYQQRGDKRTDVLKLTNRLVSAAACLSFFGSVVIAVDAFPFIVNWHWCVGTTNLRNMFLVAFKTTVFTVLWLRQGTLNNSITFNSKFVKRTIDAIRYVTITLVPVSQVTFLVATTVRGRDATIRGCQLTGQSLLIPAGISFLIFTLSQVSALGLSIAPLTLRISDQQVRKTIVRISVSTAIVFVSDVVPLAFVFMFSKQIGQWASLEFFPLIYQCIQVFQVLCIILSFRDYHIRLNPLHANNKVANKENSTPRTDGPEKTITNSIEARGEISTDNVESGDKSPVSLEEIS